MGKAVLMMLLAVVSGSAVAEWVRVSAEFNGATGYADPSTVRRAGNKATMWDAMDYKVAQDGPMGKTFLSQMNQKEYDCKEKQWRALSFSVHSGNKGTGETVFSKTEAQEWRQIVPGKSVEAMWKLACGKE